MDETPEKVKRTPFELPNEKKKQIILATENKKIIFDLEEIAKKEGGQVCLLRKKTPDLIPFNGNVRVVDRKHVGKDNWETFCEFLKEVNKEEEFPIKDEHGEVLLNKQIDWDNSRKTYDFSFQQPWINSISNSGINSNEMKKYLLWLNNRIEKIVVEVK